MGLKRHKDKTWEWTDSWCFSNEAKPECECDGVMELKDVNIKGGSYNIGGDHRYPAYDNPYLEKIWVCNKCGFVFVE
uniref:Uncharacterized protein n=1 Tax=viral metagenome TaxID=1070528 RepID=A0A6M3MAQ3_9ZZZZ